MKKNKLKGTIAIKRNTSTTQRVEKESEVKNQQAEAQ